jgi:HK97 family phage prohead protease
MDIERRTGSTELRANGRQLFGTVAPFNTPTRIGSFTEEIAPGAFRASLATGSDIVALQDHMPDRLLGRTRSGSLRLSEDGAGLTFALDLPMTTAANDLLELVRTGNAGGMSFGFVPTREDWPKPDRRILRGVDLREISIVSWAPAYPNTTVDARSHHAARMTYAASRLRLWTRTL